MNTGQKSGLRQLAAILLAAGLISPLQAYAFQSHSAIEKAITNFVKQQNVPLENLQVTITSLNKQLRIPQCEQPLIINMAPGSKLIGNSSLTVACDSPKQWKIHVAAHIDGEVNALVARYPMLRGSLVSKNDVEVVKKRYSQLNYGYFASIQQLGGMEVRRNIKTGQIITPGFVKAQKLVLRGQQVTIIAQKGGLDLRVKGKAMMDGLQGQTIKVKNMSSKKLIYARVVSPGMVRINF